MVAPIGAGGMGEVWRGKDTRLDRSVAVKILPAAFAEDEERRQRFEREARTISSLNHPHICTLFDVGHEGDAHFLVMELVEGESLAHRLQKGPLPLEQVLKVGAQVADALSAAHKQGIVHRALKPGNVMLTKAGAKLLDFGLARVGAGTSGSGSTELPTEAKPLTTAGTVLGTFQYMAPEQLEGAEADARTDIFALGTLVYEMATGRRAFEGKSKTSLIAAILSTQPPPISQVAPVMPPALDHVVRRCLAKDPADRWQSAHDLALALENLSSGSSGTAPITASFARRNRRTTALGAALAAILLVAAALGGWAALGGPHPQPTFKRLTFFRGSLDRAAFANLGQTIVYSARVDGQPSSLFSLSSGAAEPLRLGPPGTHLLSVSSRNDLLVLRNPRLWAGRNYGTLAQATVSGTGLRDLAEGVYEADWAADGQSFAMERASGVRNAVDIEFPAGRPLHRSVGSGGRVRVSPDGRRLLLFVGDFGGNAVELKLLGLDGKVETVARGPRSGSALWARSGREILLAEHDGDQTTLVEVGLSGARKTLWRGAGRFELEAADEAGRLLLSRQEREEQAEASGGDGSFPRSLSWLKSTAVNAISGDGRTLLFTASGTGGGLDGIYLRKAGEANPVRLSGGNACDLSPDGKWVLGATSNEQFRLIPTGAGTVQDLDTGPGKGSQGWFLPDGRNLLLDKSLADGSMQMVLYDLDTRQSSPAAPSGFSSFTGERPLSPDGTRMALYTVAEGATEPSFWIFSVGGEHGERLKGSHSNREVLLGWSEDGQGVLVFERGTIPAQIIRVDVATGRRQPWRTFTPVDPAGVHGLDNFEMSRDGRFVIFNYRRTLSQLYLVEGLQ
jgi:hypothetical protein